MSEPSRHARVVAVVLCAGLGARMGAGGNKVFLPLAGIPVAAWAIAPFERATIVDEILVVGRSDELERLRNEVVSRYGFRKVTQIIAGGETRHQSEERALEVLRDRITSGAVSLVMIHDGARPFVTPDEVERLTHDALAVRPAGGALLATPVAPDAVIAQVGASGVASEVYSPGQLVAAQTPQAFDARVLLAAYDAARASGFEGTDTASVVEAFGAPVVITLGSELNIKVTTPDDLLRAESLARSRLSDWSRIHGDERQV